jgi:hypothetical protein
MVTVAVRPHRGPGDGTTGLTGATAAQLPNGPRLGTLFAMYYAGLRPEEAINIGGLAGASAVWSAEPASGLWSRYLTS